MAYEYGRCRLKDLTNHKDRCDQVTVQRNWKSAVFQEGKNTLSGVVYLVSGWKEMLQHMRSVRRGVVPCGSRSFRVHVVQGTKEIK